MRTFLRLLVLLAVLLSATAVAPTAHADSTRATGRVAAAALAAPQTTITSTPRAVSTAGSALFAFEANQVGARFECSLARNGAPAARVGCPVNGRVDAAKTLATRTFRGLRVGRFVFTVKAIGSEGVPDPVAASFAWRIGPVFAPNHYAVPSGASFNNPRGGDIARRRNLTHVIRTVKSMPGYRVNSTAVCDPSAPPSTIRVSLYSMADMNFAKALVAANRRCVSVRVLMNNHLGPKKVDAIRYLQRGLGGSVRTSAGVVRRSFAHRCNYGCRGGGVLHSKFYLFDSAVPHRGRRISGTVMVGSSNMTANAAKVQWNDLYTVRGNATLHGQFLGMFNRMQRDRDERRTFRFTTGPYQTTFAPQTPGSPDTLAAALRSVHCLGARAGTGISGHAVVHINMHAWFGLRGYALAKQVRAMHDRGCYVRVLYSFLSRSVYNKLTVGTGSRMSVRRTIFSRHGGKQASLYSHFKMIAASGYVGGNRSARVVWTGSNNFTNHGLKFDEVTFRIASARAYRDYRNQFAFISRTRSSGSFASFAEPPGPDGPRRR